MHERMEAIISAYIRRYCEERKLAYLWREPIVGFADASSEFFLELRSLVVENHQKPQDFLPEARNVLCYFLPFREEIGTSNVPGRLVSKQWADAYLVTNEMAVSLNEHLVEEIKTMGFDAAVPQNTLTISRENLRSRWSQRHIAWLAGIGTFGINNMLISKRGCCGRYFSVVTTLPVAPDKPLDTERCRYRREGTCGVCAKRCPGDALTFEGFDRKKCDLMCSRNLADHPGANVCGKCVVGLPCTFQGA